MNKIFIKIRRRNFKEIISFFFYKYSNKLNFKKKKIKINFLNKLILLKKKSTLKFLSLFNVVEFEGLFKTVFTYLTSCIRNLVSVYFMKERNLSICNNSYIISSEMFLPSLFLFKNSIVFLESTLENIEQVRNSFLNRIISIFIKNDLNINILNNLDNSNFYPSILFIVPNQTILIQIVRVLYEKVTLKKNNSIYLLKKKFKNNDYSNIKNGKLIYPADKRVYFSDGEKDLFELNISVKKNFLIFNSEIKNSDITFLTPLTLCKFSKKKSNLVFSNLKICIIDELSSLANINFEIFLSILKKIMLFNKKNVSSSFKNFNNFNNPFFQVFLISNIMYKENLSILTTISKNSFCLFYELKNKRCYLESKNYNYKLFKFSTTAFEKIPEKRFDFFIARIFLLLKIEINNYVLVFNKTYFEHVLLRNFIWKFKELAKFEIIDFNEYTKENQFYILKKKNLKNQRNIVLVTERFYFYNRYIFKNFSKIIFYTFPLNWEFYNEICSFLKNNSLYKVYLILHFSDIRFMKKIFGSFKTEQIFQS